MEYLYVLENRLLHPHAYQFSPYGNNFMESYSASRQAFLRECGGEIDIDTLLKDMEHHSFPTGTAEKLKTLIPGVGNFSPILRRFVKKYEVGKKLYDAYDKDFRQVGERFESPSQYLLLSLACLLYYRQKGNLVFLNCALKLNDLLCSIAGDMMDPFDRRLFAACLQLEHHIIGNLYSSKNIRL